MAETLAVTFVSNSWVLLPAAGYALLLIPHVRILALAYIIYIKFVSNAHKTRNRSRSHRFRSSWLWRLHATYFPIKLYRSAPLSPRRKYIFAGHPHGVAMHGLTGAFSADGTGFARLFPGIKNTMLVKDQMFTTPLLREYLFALGQSGVSRDSCIQHLTRGGYDLRGMGNAITISVGGSREYRIARPGTMGIVVKIRRGVVRLAIETGADLVPVLVFGENELFHRIETAGFSLKALVAWVWEKAVGHKVAFSLGRFNLFCPYRVPVHVVAGRPVTVRQQRFDIEDSYIDEIQAQYIDELKTIWANWKDTFVDDASVKFEIIE